MSLPGHVVKRNHIMVCEMDLPLFQDESSSASHLIDIRAVGPGSRGLLHPPGVSGNPRCVRLNYLNS